MGSIIYGAAVKYLLNEKEIEVRNFIQFLGEIISDFSKSFKDDDFILTWVHEWNKKPLYQMQFKEVFQKTRNESLHYLNSIKEKISRDDLEYYRLTNGLNEKFKGSGVSTVTIAIFLFLKYLDNPQKAILKAVNTLGSDTDTIAAFVGGLFGAFYGSSIIPTNLLDRLQDKNYIFKAADHLFKISNFVI